MTTRPLAVTFDFWDTLVRAPTAADVRLARRDRLVGVLATAGVGIEPATLDAVLARIRVRFDECWEANEQFTGVDATALMIDLLGVAVDPGIRPDLERSFMGLDLDDLPDLTPNVALALTALRDAGVRLGIICDVGLSPSSMLRGHLDRHGVLDLFDHWSFSDEVGVYKPDPRIFDHALTGLGGIAASRSAHVGDLRRTDIAGASAFGMTTIRYAGTNDDAGPVPRRPGRVMRASATPDVDPPLTDPTVAGAESDDMLADADHVITDHRDLLSVLGL